MIRAACTAFAIALFAVPAASASEAAREATARNLAAGTLAAGGRELSRLIAADPRDQDARLGLGMIGMVDAVENLAAGFYRYGTRANPGPMPLPFMAPTPGLPRNPNPSPISYEDYRGLLQAFVDDVAKAEATLAGVTDPAVKVPIDLAAVAMDIDGDGKASAGEERIFAQFMQVRPAGGAPPASPMATTAAFDLGDALWLRGYAHVLMAAGEFLLAHDLRATFDKAMTLVFAHVVSPMGEATTTDQPLMFGVSTATFADLLAFIHLINWQVAEPRRLLAVRDHLKAVTALSRQTWTAIEAETDDDREWLPSPRQTSAVVPMKVTEEQIKQWRLVLDEADAVLDGRKLLPHWRFQKGVNLRLFFERPTAFDLVLWISGPAALPYLQDGEVTSTATWNRLTPAFGSNFSNYMLWFN